MATSTRASSKAAAAPGAAAQTDPLADYVARAPEPQAAICRQLHGIIHDTLSGAACKVWHGSPVWFIGDNPVVGYNYTAKCVKLLFWNGQEFGEPGLVALGKFKAAQIQYTDPAQIDPASVRRWLKKSSTQIWDYQQHFCSHVQARSAKSKATRAAKPKTRDGAATPKRKPSR